MRPIADVDTGRVIAFANGRWFDGERLVARTFYGVGGTLAAREPTRIDSVIDLSGGYVIPPFAEAHNHNIEGDPAAVNARYPRDGVFYAQNPMNVLLTKEKFAPFVNNPRGIDATFSNAGLTAPGGHPMALYLRNVACGGMLPTDINWDSVLLACFARDHSTCATTSQSLRVPR